MYLPAAVADEPAAFDDVEMLSNLPVTFSNLSTSWAKSCADILRLL